MHVSRNAQRSPTSPMASKAAEGTSPTLSRSFGVGLSTQCCMDGNILWTSMARHIDLCDASRLVFPLFVSDSAYSVLSVAYLISSYLICRSMIISCQSYCGTRIMAKKS
jgi:hypothetical protein